MSSNNIESGSVSYSGGVSVPAGTFTATKTDSSTWPVEGPLTKRQDAPTAPLRKRLVADMNANIDLGDQQLLGGAVAFVTVNNEDASIFHIYASQHTHGWLLDQPVESREKLASHMLCQLRTEIRKHLGLNVPPCECHGVVERGAIAPFTGDAP